MAVALDGFSIRGYTAKKRTVDIEKCWPFQVAGTAPSLPPISVPQFRWWSNELESGQLLYSNLDLKDDTSATASGTKLTVRNHGKGKQRLPKKRFVAELFVAAPQIDVISTDDGNEGEQGVSDVWAGSGEKEGENNSPETADGAVGGPNGAVSEPSKKSRKAKEACLTKMKNNRKKKRSNEEICAAKEEKIHKSKVLRAVYISNLLRDPTSKRFRKKHKVLVDGQKNKQPIRKHLYKKHSSKVTQSSKLLDKAQEGPKIFPGHSILKNKTRVSPTKKAFEGDTHCGNLKKSRHEFEKHVTFSGKDHVLGYNKSCSSNHTPKIQSHCKIFSDVLAASSTIKDAAAIVAENSVCSLSENRQVVADQYPAAVSTDISDRNYPDTEKTFISGTLDLNCAVQSFDISDCSEHVVSSLLPNYLNACSSPIGNVNDVEGLSSNTGFQAAESSAGFQAESSFMTSNVGSRPASIGISSTTLTSTATIAREFVTDPLSMQENDFGTHLPLETKINPAWHNPKCQSACDIVGLNNHAELRASPDSLPICRDRSTVNGLTGLPLGSEGELIKSYSSGDSMRNADPCFQQEPNPLRSSHGFRESTRPAVQMTVRLMGKDLTVGQNSIACEASDDGKIWTDKEIIAQQCPDAPSGIPWPQRDQITQNRLHQLEAPSNHYNAPTTDPLFSCLHFDCIPQWVSSTGLFSTKESHDPNGKKSCHPLPPKEFQSKASKSIVDSISVTKSSEMANRMPVVQSHRQNVSQQILLNSSDCKGKQIHSSSKTSSFCSPVPDPEKMNIDKPFYASTSSYLPQWLLNAKREKYHRIPFPDTDPYSIQALRSSLRESMVPLFSNVPSQKSCLSTQASSAHPALTSSCLARKSTPAVNPVNGDKINRRDGREYNFDLFELLDKSNATRKRLSTGGNDSIREVKKSNIAVYRKSTAPSRPRPVEHLVGYMPFTSTGIPETPSYGNRVMDADIVALNNEKNGFRHAPQSSSLEHGGASKSGPIKLIAGAKHILKPNQNVDKDNSRPVHSTIPLATESSSCIISASRKKATKIYKF